MMVKPRAGSPTVDARLGPCLAAAAAMAAQPAKRHVNGNHESIPGLASRHEHLAPQHVVVFMLAEKGVAHALDGELDVREVDGDFVREAVLGHRGSVNDRERSSPCQGRRASVK